MQLSKLLNQIGNRLEEWIDTLGGLALEKKETKMCSSLKTHWAEKAPIKIGESFPSEVLIEKIQNNQTQKVSNQVVWNGFARDDSLDKWVKGGWIPALLHIHSYVESDQHFMVPENHLIKAIILEKDKTYLNIVTRKAATEKEKEIHPRWPLTQHKEV